MCYIRCIYASKKSFSFNLNLNIPRPSCKKKTKRAILQKIRPQMSKELNVVIKKKTQFKERQLSRCCKYSKNRPNDQQILRKAAVVLTDSMTAQFNGLEMSKRIKKNSKIWQDNFRNNNYMHGGLYETFSINISISLHFTNWT